jgi:hypothetical protein
MLENPTADHCLRLTTVTVSLTSFVLAAYAFLLDKQSTGSNSFGKGFFSILVFLGVAGSLTSIAAYMFKSYRTILFYLSLIYIMGALIMLVPIMEMFYLL